MKEKTITVIMIEPHKHPITVMLDNNLEALQKAVSIGTSVPGVIKIVTLERGVCLL